MSDHHHQAHLSLDLSGALKVSVHVELFSDFRLALDLGPVPFTGGDGAPSAPALDLEKTVELPLDAIEALPPDFEAQENALEDEDDVTHLLEEVPVFADASRPDVRPLRHVGRLLMLLLSCAFSLSAVVAEAGEAQAAAAVESGEGARAREAIVLSILPILSDHADAAPGLVGALAIRLRTNIEAGGEAALALGELFTGMVSSARIAPAPCTGMAVIYVWTDNIPKSRARAEREAARVASALSLQHVTLRGPVGLELWGTPRSAIPAGPDGLKAWLWSVGACAAVEVGQ